jgi:hypothetical protein
MLYSKSKYIRIVTVFSEHSTNIAQFRYMMPCILVERYERFGRTLKMDAADSSERLVTLYQNVLRHIP